MATPFIGQISIFGFTFAPKNFAYCNGQLLSINQNQALFSLLGTTYGGNGTTTFGLPNLQGRTPMHVGTGFVLGQVGGEEAHTLTVSEIPVHTHGTVTSTAAGTAGDPSAAFLADGSKAAYAPGTPNQTMAAGAIGNTGGSQSHNNMAPYLTINFCIALVGIFPSRN